MANQPGVLKRFFTKFSEDEVTTQAAALSFYTTLALAPTLLLVMTVLGILAPSSQDRAISAMVELGGSQIEPFLRDMIQSAEEQPNLRQIAGWVSFLLLLISASALFAQLQAAMNKVWNAEDPNLTGASGLIQRRLLSIGMLMTIVFVSIATLVVQAALSMMQPGATGVWFLVGWLVSVGIYTVLFAALYHWLPDKRVPWSTAFRGGAITAVLFMLGRAAVGFYLANSDAGGAFGAAGSVVLWLLWAYYIGIVYLASAVLVYVLAHQRGWAWFDEPPADEQRGSR